MVNTVGLQRHCFCCNAVVHFQLTIKQVFYFPSYVVAHQKHPSAPAPQMNSNILEHKKSTQPWSRWATAESRWGNTSRGPAEELLYGWRESIREAEHCCVPEQELTQPQLPPLGVSETEDWSSNSRRLWTPGHSWQGGKEQRAAGPGLSSQSDHLPHRLLNCILLKITPSPKKAAAESNSTGLLLRHLHKLTTTQTLSICSRIVVECVFFFLEKPPMDGCRGLARTLKTLKPSIWSLHCDPDDAIVTSISDKTAFLDWCATHCVGHRAVLIGSRFHVQFP